jgi:predicted RecA/RadA family phage recombinase
LLLEFLNNLAAEVSIIELIGKVPGCPVRFQVTSGAFTKGSLMVAVDPRKAALHTNVGQGFLGVAAEDVTAASGVTNISIYTNGIFDITAAAAGAQNIGKVVMLSATANMTKACDATGLLISKVGYVIEEQANDERAAVRINGGCARAP